MNLAAAIDLEWGPVADTAGGIITVWRHPTLAQPTQAELDAAMLKYARHAAKLRIDAHAGAARDRFVSPGELIGTEYTRAYDQAAAWLADQTQPVPASVQSWADAKGWTALQAAQDIQGTGDYWHGLLDSIRDIRLKKKALVDAAATEAEVEQIVQDAITALDAL